MISGVGTLFEREGKDGDIARRSRTRDQGLPFRGLASSRGTSRGRHLAKRPSNSAQLMPCSYLRATQSRSPSGIFETHDIQYDIYVSHLKNALAALDRPR